MRILVIGFKTQSTQDVGEVICHVTDAQKAQEAVNAAADKGFIRFDKLVNPRGFPCFPEAKPAAPAPVADSAKPVSDESKPTQPKSKK
jgi:hypothetical protein